MCARREANLHAASAAIGIAVANRLPGITLTGNIGTDANTFGKMFSPGAAYGVWAPMSPKQFLTPGGLPTSRAPPRPNMTWRWRNTARRC